MVGGSVCDPLDCHWCVGLCVVVHVHSRTIHRVGRRKGGHDVVGWSAGPLVVFDFALCEEGWVLPVKEKIKFLYSFPFY